MSTSKAVAKQDSGSTLPALWGGEDQISASDVKAPEIRITQGNSKAATEGLAKVGDVIFTYGSEDGSPTVLIGKGKQDPNDFVGYVVAREKFAATTTGGGLTFHDTPVRDMDDPGSWEGWFFYIAVPELDPILPARTMMWRSNAAAARQINGYIQRAKARGDYDPIAIRVSTVDRANDKGAWTIYRIAQIGKDEIDQDELAMAESMRPIALDMIQNRIAYAAQRADAATMGTDQPEV